MTCEALVLGLHLLTYHPSNLETFTPGVYAQCDNLTVGAYRNSHRDPSAYVGYTVKGTVDFTVGYLQYYKLPMPLFVPSYKVNDNIRIILMLSPVRRSNTGLNLSIEW